LIKISTSSKSSTRYLSDTKRFEKGISKFEFNIRTILFAGTFSISLPVIKKQQKRLSAWIKNN
jgi:hypothetical protein